MFRFTTMAAVIAVTLLGCSDPKNSSAAYPGDGGEQFREQMAVHREQTATYDEQMAIYREEAAAYDEQMAAYREQVAAYERQTAGARWQPESSFDSFASPEVQFQRVVNQMDRMNRLLIRWEEQTDRFEVLLNRWEAMVEMDTSASTATQDSSVTVE